jgi:hypothetical protein
MVKVLNGGARTGVPAAIPIGSLRSVSGMQFFKDRTLRTLGTAAVGPEESPLLAAHHEIFTG